MVPASQGCARSRAAEGARKAVVEVAADQPQLCAVQGSGAVHSAKAWFYVVPTFTDILLKSKCIKTVYSQALALRFLLGKAKHQLCFSRFVTPCMILSAPVPAAVTDGWEVSRAGTEESPTAIN